MSNKIGVFVCHCGINIASLVDVKALTSYAKTLDGVVASKEYKYMCSDVGANLIKDSIIISKIISIFPLFLNSSILIKNNVNKFSFSLTKKESEKSI